MAFGFMDRIKLTLKDKALVVFLGLSLLSPLAGNWISLSNNCENNYDFGIYQQAIYDSFSLGKANPYLSVRDIYALQDHFDPVFLLAGPWAWLFNYSPYSLLVFEWLFLVASLGCLILYSRNKKEALLWCFILLWSRGIMTAMNYPIHPTTWSMLPITLLCISLHEGREKLFWASFLSLLFFKEIFPLATLSLGLAFLMAKEWKKGGIVFLISLVFCLFNFQWRGILLEGETYGYGTRILGPYLIDFMGTVKKEVMNFNIKAFIYSFLPSLIVLSFASFKRALGRSDLFILAFYLPLFAIHMIHGHFDFQYGVVLSLPPLLILWKKRELLSNKKFKIVLSLALVLTSARFHETNIRHILGKNDKCEISPSHRESIRKVRRLIFNYPPETTILATGGSIPSILRPRAKIYHAKRVRSKNPPQYDLVLIGNEGDFWPMTEKEILQAHEVCQGEDSANILFEDRYHLLLKGPVSEECLVLLR